MTRRVIASCLVISLGVILCYHFALFWIHGGVYIHEPNTVILVIESAGAVGIVGFGLMRLVNTFRR